LITEEHLSHWLNEMSYQLTGLINELNKKEFLKTNSFPLNGTVFSFEYAREKSNTVKRLISTIVYDMQHDGDGVPN